MRKFVMAALVVVLSSLASGAKAADLNLLHLNFPGSIWGRLDERMSAYGANDPGQTRTGRFMMLAEQGIQSTDFPHVVLYVAGNVYQPFAAPQDSYLSLGVKNTTLLPMMINPLFNAAGLANIHAQFGIEHQDSSVMNVSVPVASRTVGFMSFYMEWGTGGTNIAQ